MQCLRLVVLVVDCCLFPGVLGSACVLFAVAATWRLLLLCSVVTSGAKELVAGVLCGALGLHPPPCHRSAAFAGFLPVNEADILDYVYTRGVEWSGSRVLGLGSAYPPACFYISGYLDNTARVFA